MWAPSVVVLVSFPVLLALLTPIVIVLGVILSVWFVIKIMREEPTHRDPD